MALFLLTPETTTSPEFFFIQVGSSPKKLPNFPSRLVIINLKGLRLSPKTSHHHRSILRVTQKNLMFAIAYAVTIFLFLAAAVMGVSGCAGIDLKSPSQEVKAFFVAGKEAQYLALQCPASGSVDLSAYSHLMEVKYPRTFQVDVLQASAIQAL